MRSNLILTDHARFDRAQPVPVRFDCDSGSLRLRHGLGTGVAAAAAHLAASQSRLWCMSALFPANALTLISRTYGIVSRIVECCRLTTASA